MIGVTGCGGPVAAVRAARRARRVAGYPGSLLRLAYRRVPSFRAERGGLYCLYAWGVYALSRRRTVRHG